LPSQIRRPGRDPRGRRWFPAREVQIDAAPLRYGGINVGPVTRDDDAIPSALTSRINQPSLATTGFLFLKSLMGITREYAAIAAASTLIVVPATAPQVQANLLVSPIQLQADDAKPSRLVRVTPADLQPPSLDRPLYGRFQPIETPPPSKMATPGSLVEQGLANLLYQRALTGVVQPDVIVPSSNVVRVPFAEITPWIQYPLAGVFQDIAVFDSSKIVRIPFADVPPTALNLFLQPLVGRDQFEQPRFGVSLLVGSQLPITLTPLRALVGVQQDVVDRDPPRIIRIPFEIVTPAPVVLRSLTGIYRPSFDESQLEDISIILFDLEPERDVLFLYPHVGKDQPPTVVDASRIVRVIPPDPQPPPFVLFQYPLFGKDQPPTIVGVPGIITVIPATPHLDPLFQYPRVAIIQIQLVTLPSQIVRVIPPDPLAPPGAAKQQRRRWHRSGG